MKLTSIASTLEEPHVLLRREALAAGMDDAALKRAVLSGELVRVRHGAYVSGDAWAAADTRERHLLDARAVHRIHGDRIVLSHHTAAVLHGLDLWGVDLDTVHVSRTDAAHGRHASRLVHHQGRVVLDEVSSVRGLPVVAPARAALESASMVSVEQALITVDSVLRQGLADREALEEQYLQRAMWPDSLGLRLITELADGRHESAGETRTAHLMWRAGLPIPVPQLEVYWNGQLIGRVDFAWPELGVVLEFDGKAKYVKYLRPGETITDAVLREKRREDRIREATGWTVIRVVWSDLADPDALVERIRRAMRCAAA